MANAVFNSLEDYYRRNQLRPDVPYSKFDLSNIRNQDMDFGVLTPFYLEDCVPGDRFRISQIAKLTALPLYNPLFNRIKLSTYFFFVPYYLLWRHFDRFIEGGRDGSYVAELPYVCCNSLSDPLHFANNQTISRWLSNNSLWDYLNFQPTFSNQVEDDITTFRDVYFPKVSAFPFAAYQRIFRDYFFDQDVQTSTNVNEWFPEDDADFVLDDGANLALGGHKWSTPPVSEPPYLRFTGPGGLVVDYTDKPWLLALHTKNFNRDYFTSLKFSPQRGNLNTVPTYLTATLDFSGVVDTQQRSSFGVVQTTYDSSDGSDGHLISTSTDSSTYQPVGTSSIVSALNRGKVNVSGAGFNLADLHLAQQIEIWAERNMSVKAQYNEFLRIHFNDAPLDERLTKPYLIGSNVQDVYISEVLQTSESGNTPQGTATGHAISSDSGFIGSFHCHEYGLIMGIACIMPETYYNTGTDRHWTKSSRFDFYFPEFADLEPQAVLRSELVQSDSHSFDDAFNNHVLGYQGRNDEYRQHRSSSVGCFRDPVKTDFTSWVIARDVGSTPILDNKLVNSHTSYSVSSSPAYFFEFDGTSYKEIPETRISHDSFTSGYAANPFIVQFGISVTAVRPMPYVSDPTRVIGGR